ncbi:MAG: DUF1090 domain-containing protein [Variovorax sp.]|nr:MAG: DUF1090 domain-containing protein [Variovorax sp.]
MAGSSVNTRHVVPAIAAVLLFASLQASAQPAAGAACEAKREAIGRDIEEAREKGQKQRLRGLERALSENKRHCTDAKLQAAQRQRVEQQEKKVAERERDLKQAERQGDIGKVARRKEKLTEAQAELQRVKTSP